MLLFITYSKVQLSKFLSVKMQLFSYPAIETYVFGAQKNRLIETQGLGNGAGAHRIGKISVI